MLQHLAQRVREQGFRIRLGDVAVGAEPQAPADVLGFVLGREHDHRQETQARVFAYVDQEVEAISVGEFHVEKDYIRHALRAQRLDEGMVRRGDADLVTGEPKPSLGEGGLVGVIFNDEDGDFCGGFRERDPL